jgi:hypothetical protein
MNNELENLRILCADCRMLNGDAGEEERPS